MSLFTELCWPLGRLSWEVEFLRVLKDLLLYWFLSLDLIVVNFPEAIENFSSDFWNWRFIVRPGSSPRSVFVTDGDSMSMSPI